MISLSMTNFLFQQNNNSFVVKFHKLKYYPVMSVNVKIITKKLKLILNTMIKNEILIYLHFFKSQL